MSSRVALITGITGQDGSYLTELLLSKDYIVYGIIRRGSSSNTGRIDHVLANANLHLLYGDLTDSLSLTNAINLITANHADAQVIEIYNLAAQSHVKVSFDVPEYTGEVDALGTLRLLEVIRCSPMKDKIRFYQASTSELYGKVLEIPQRETTPFNPQSPYAVAKLYSYWIVKNYREAYGLYAVNGILFNHTSPRRGENFVCRKITMAVAAIKKGKQEELVLGNLNASRDLGHARDYVEGMWRMLQQKPGVETDYVLSMKDTYTVKQLVEMSFSVIGVSIQWSGEGVDEVGVDAATGKTLIRVDSAFFRPAEVDLLIGDSTRAHEELGWTPTRTTEQILKEMVQADLALA
jgi:GDPmannose 4,6-dehydratase